jgi:hypothetical protein
MQISPEEIQDLTTIAFCLEPLAEKEGCTTRTKDLPDKPLGDFLIAGINSSKYFRYLAQDLKEDKSVPVFKYLPVALVNTNNYKSLKTINFGLLQIMFFAVKARVLEDDRTNIIAKMSEILNKESLASAQFLLESCKKAWRTSSNSAKRDFNADAYQDVSSLSDLYQKIAGDYPSDHSLHQWSNELLNGFKLIDSMLNIFGKMEGSRLDVLASIFNKAKKDNPALKNGIIADFCAAALFLDLSYLEKKTS